MLIAIITSAVVGSAVAAGLQMLAAHLERRARRRELLLARALDLAKARTEFIMRTADKTGATATLRDDIFLAEGYFRWLSHLMDHGELPAEAHATEEASRQGLPKR